MLKIISIDELMPGMLVTQVLEQNGPVKIRKVGMIRSPDMLKGLKEMGVIRVEVDLEQSVGVQVQSENDDMPNELTPTQQLMQSDKAVASADRELSAQFHRSMFMPSPETLPSKWHLYGRTMSIFVVLFLVGGLFGFSLANAPSWYKDFMEAEMAQRQVDETEAVASEVNIPNDDAAAKDELTEEVGEDLNDKQLNVSESVPKPAPMSEPEPAPEPEQLVLGYQPESVEQGLSQLGNQSIPQNSNQVDSQASQVIENNQNNISPDLLARFNAAIAELDAEKQSSTEQDDAPEYDDVPRVDQLSVALLTDLPSMSFSAHMYASAPQNRWVRVNGLRLIEGDFIADQLQIVNIEPQRVILSFRDKVFAMNALTDW